MDEKAYDKYQRIANPKAVAEASAVHGRVIFARTCGSCHKMYGEGGIIGPELTGSNRANLDYLLFTILNPSGEIQDDYKMVGQDAVVLNKADMQSRELTPVSMMPTGLLETLTDAEVVDLVAYMRTTAPVGRPETVKLARKLK